MTRQKKNLKNHQRTLQKYRFNIEDDNKKKAKMFRVRVPLLLSFIDGGS